MSGSNRVEKLRQTEEGKRLLERERVIVEATEQLAYLMRTCSVSNTDLAERMNRSVPFVTKLLRGTNNFTLATLAEAHRVLGRSLHLDHGPISDKVSNEGCARIYVLPTWELEEGDLQVCRAASEREQTSDTESAQGQGREEYSLAG